MHSAWLNSVEKRVGLNELAPQPYWGIQDLFRKVGTKVNKTVYAIADRKRENGIEYFHYSKFLMLKNFKLEISIEALVRGYVLVDFDARTGHNHGTKFRLRQDKYPYLVWFGSRIEYENSGQQISCPVSVAYASIIRRRQELPPYRQNSNRRRNGFLVDLVFPLNADVCPILAVCVQLTEQFHEI